MKLEKIIPLSVIVKIESAGKPGENLDQECPWSYFVSVGGFNMGSAVARIVDNHYELFWEYNWNDRGSYHKKESIGIVDIDKPEEADSRLRKVLNEKVEDIVHYMGMIDTD